MRAINTLVVHCSATPAGKPFHASDIDGWHRKQGWSGIGYHYVITLDGTVEPGRPLHMAGAHVSGHNANTIGICYIGGMNAENTAALDTLTERQADALDILLRGLQSKFPGVRILGHRDLSPDKDGDGVIEKHEWMKLCPSFDVPAWCVRRGIVA